MKKYNNLTLSRTPNEGQVILGIGHVVFDKALADALSLQANVGISSALKHNILVFSVVDQLTDGDQEKLNRILAVEISSAGDVKNILADWELLKLLNELSTIDTTECSPTVSSEDIRSWEVLCTNALREHLTHEEYVPKIPVFTLEAILFATP